MNHDITGDDARAFVKRAAIMCDRLFFNTQGVPREQEFSFVGLAAAGREEWENIGKSKNFREMFVLPSDLGDEEEVFGQLSNASDGERPFFEAAQRVVEAIPDSDLEWKAAPWRGVDYKTRGALIHELVDDLTQGDALRMWFEQPVGLLTPLHLRVIHELSSEWLTDTHAQVLQEIEESRAIDFGAMSWKEILDLRKSGFHSDFTARLDEIGKSLDPDVTRSLWQDLWNAAGDTMPQIRRTSVTGVLANLPVGLPVNPMSIFASAKAVAESKELKTKYGWLYFILEAGGTGA